MKAELHMLRNAFIGNNPHEATFLIIDGNLGDIRRFAVNSEKDAIEKARTLEIEIVKTVKHKLSA